MRQSEEKQYFDALKKGKRPRSKHSPEWTNLKKVKSKGREKKEDPIRAIQATLDDAKPKE